MTETTLPVKAAENPTPATREEDRFLAPPVDIYETPDGLVAVADLPGVDKDSISVRVDDGVLTIKATPRHLNATEPDCREYQLLPFHRQFQLGEAVDQERIGATLKNGVLTVLLPKAEKAKPRQIAVTIS